LKAEDRLIKRLQKDFEAVYGGLMRPGYLGFFETRVQRVNLEDFRERFNTFEHELEDRAFNWVKYFMFRWYWRTHYYPFLEFPSTYNYKKSGPWNKNT